jgi:ubiquinone/menaquinone biosynthesis C-methylase UbiE
MALPFGQPVDQKRFYDSQAENFEKGFLFNRGNRNHFKKISKICDLFNLKQNNRPGFLVLEVGTGSGLHAGYVIQNFEFIHYIGIDLSEKMLNLARTRSLSSLKEKCDLAVGDGMLLPFNDNTFDAVYISGSLHHFSHPFEGIQEICRVTKPGGSIAVMEPNRFFPINFFYAVFNPLERNILRMSRGNLMEWAMESPLTDVNVSNFIYTPPLSFLDSKFLDRIDTILEKIPIISGFSIMVYLKAIKVNSEER